MDAGTTTCFVVFFLVIVAILIANSYAARSRAQKLQAAREAYQQALVKLKQQPHNPDTKQHALNLGREYSNLTREQKGVTIFDEMALMNDISAATAAAGSAAAPSSTTTAGTVEERLKRLDELRSKGLVNDQEYDTRRKKILDEL